MDIGINAFAKRSPTYLAASSRISRSLWPRFSSLVRFSRLLCVDEVVVVVVVPVAVAVAAAAAAAKAAAATVGEKAVEAAGCFCVRLRDDVLVDDAAVLVADFSDGDVSLDGVDARESD